MPHHKLVWPDKYTKRCFAHSRKYSGQIKALLDFQYGGTIPLIGYDVPAHMSSEASCKPDRPTYLVLLFSFIATGFCIFGYQTRSGHIAHGAERPDTKSKGRSRDQASRQIYVVHTRIYSRPHLGIRHGPYRSTKRGVHPNFVITL